MQVDYCLILAAGHGTRMGRIGKELPKVLWPVFEKSILELEIAYAKKLGIKKIYINTHTHHDLIEQHLKERGLINDVVLLHEKKLLGSGGAFHNLARQKEINYKGKVLKLNGDLFYMMPKGEATEACLDSDANLFAVKVLGGSHYNELILNDELELVDIKKNESCNSFYTFSGVGVVDLNSLERTPGESSFFDSVARFNENKVKVTCPKRECEYWDFGTLERYYVSMTSLAQMIQSNEESEFVSFLKEAGAINLEKIGRNEVVAGDFIIGDGKVIYDKKIEELVL